MTKFIFRLNLLICISTLSTLLTTAQIVILNTDMPRVNDTLRYSNSTSTLNYLATDTNYTWDFSNLKIDNQDVQRYYAPLQTPYVLQFLSATYGIPEANLGLGPLGGGTASDVFSFYKTSTAAAVVLGRGATIQSLPLGIVYSLRDTVFKYPLTYGNSYSGSYKGESGLPGLGTLKQSGTRTTVVDGWGKITTPLGTFDCIRVKSTVVGTDSIILTGFGIPIPGNRTEYTWLAKNQRFPILEVVVNNLTSQISSLRFKDQYRPEAYLNNCNFNASQTQIKPGDTVTFTNQSFGNPKTFNWQITPNTYKFAGGSNAGSEFPKIIFDSLGYYNVKLSVTYEGGADDTLKLNFIRVREPLIANFEANITQVKQTDTIQFTDLSTGSPATWLWTITPISGFTYLNGTSMNSKNPKISFSNAGSYTVQLRVTSAGRNSTTKKDNYIQVWPTGLNTIEKSPFAHFFPNPGKTFLQVELTNKVNGQVCMYNMLGNKVLEKPLTPGSDNQFSIADLPRGIYLIEISQGSQKLSKRLVLE